MHKPYIGRVGRSAQPPRLARAVGISATDGEPGAQAGDAREALAGAKCRVCFKSSTAADLHCKRQSAAAQSVYLQLLEAQLYYFDVLRMLCVLQCEQCGFL
jgi:hypothetical protein